MVEETEVHRGGVLGRVSRGRRFGAIVSAPQRRPPRAPRRREASIRRRGPQESPSPSAASANNCVMRSATRAAVEANCRRLHPRSNAARQRRNSANANRSSRPARSIDNRSIACCTAPLLSMRRVERWKPAKPFGRARFLPTDSFGAGGQGESRVVPRSASLGAIQKANRATSRRVAADCRTKAAVHRRTSADSSAAATDRVAASAQIRRSSRARAANAAGRRPAHSTRSSARQASKRSFAADELEDGRKLAMTSSVSLSPWRKRGGTKGRCAAPSSPSEAPSKAPERLPLLTLET